MDLWALGRQILFIFKVLISAFGRELVFIKNRVIKIWSVVHIYSVILGTIS